MADRAYTENEVRTANGSPLSSPDPETSYFVGPTSESDEVFAFAHKLDGFHFVTGYFGDHLAESEKTSIQAQIDMVADRLADSDTASLTDLLEDNTAVEIYAEGYWPDFVEQSAPLWPEWAEEFTDVMGNTGLYDDMGDDDSEVADMVDDDDEFDMAERGFIYSEPPEDVFNTEFVEALLKIIPFS